jgi:hypothetical protein
VAGTADPTAGFAEKRFVTVANGALEHGVIRGSVREKRD